MYPTEDLLKRLKPVIGNRADQIWHSFLSADPQERLLIHQSLEQMHTQMVDNYQQEKIILTPPNKFEHLHGDYPAGMVYYGDSEKYPFAFQMRELTQHLGVFGRTGAGKSYFVKNLLRTHIFNKTPSMVFDWKATYTDIRGVQHITPGISEWCFNPLDLSNIRPDVHQTYISHLVELFLDSYLEDLKLLTVQGVESLILKAIKQLLPRKAPITFHDIIAYLHIYKGRQREHEWKITAINLLEKMVSGTLGKSMSGTSVDIRKLTKSQIVFDLSNIGSAKDKTFFIRSLLLQLYHHYRLEGATSSLRNLLILEEAHNVLLKKFEGKESVIDLMLRQVREFGVGLCVVDQSPSSLSPSALGTYATVAFNLKLKQDRDAMASALNLAHSEMLGRLPPRFCIIKLADRFMTPFLLKTNNVSMPPMPKPATDGSDHEQPDVPEHLREVIAAVEKLRCKVPSNIQTGSRELYDVYGRIRMSSQGVTRDEKDRTHNSQAYQTHRVRLKSAKYDASQGNDGNHHRQRGCDDQNKLSGVARAPSQASQVPSNLEYSGKKAENKEGNDCSKTPDDNEVTRVARIGSDEVAMDGAEVTRVARVPMKVMKVFQYMMNRRKEPLSFKELLLCHIYAFPLKQTIEHYTALGWNSYQGNKVMHALKDQKYIVQETIRTKKGRAKRLIITNTGCVFLQKQGFGVGKNKKRSGVQHRYWQRRLRGQFERLGYSVEIEATLDEHNSVDMVVSSQTKKVAIEVETGSNSYDHMTHNIEKCQGKFDGVVSYILNQTKADEMQKRKVKGAIIVTAESECISYVQSILR